jgi:hypothetical protein|tara:strand:+ start:11771 stop:13849 length:2079 start_codon:yes stop_codon:yes gene_type:complete
MATAYKYVERQVDDQINWAEVTSNLTNTLKEEGRVRQEKKTAIDDASREYAKILNNVPVGENTELNKFALNAASDLQQQMLMQTTLLKSGQLDPRQYTIMRQNLTDGTDQAFSLFQNYNAEYDKKMAMMDPNLPPNERASAMQTWQMSELEGFGNFKNSKLVINPNTGLMSMAKMVPDPNFTGDPVNSPMVPDMNNLQSVQALENRLKGTVTQYDVMGAADTYLDSLGEDKRAVITGLGQKYTSATIKTISDATAKQKGSWKSMSTKELDAEAKRLGVNASELIEITLFSEAQDNWVKGQLGIGGTAAASVLLDYKSINPITSEPYEQLQWSEANEAKAALNSNIILMKNVDGRMVPDLSDDQQAEAERVMKTQINIGLDYEEDIKAVKTGFEATPEPKDVRDGKKEIEKKQNLQKVWNQIKSQSAEDRIASFESLIGTEIAKSAGLIGVNPSEDGTSISFVYIDSQKAKNRTIDIDANISDEEWAIIGNEITGLDDPTAALAAGGFGKDTDGNPLPYNADFGTSGANREGNLQRFDAELSSFVDDGFPATEGGEPFLDLEQDEVVIALNDRYSKFGLKAVATGYGGADNTRVTIEGWSGDGVHEQSYDLDSDTDVDSTALEDQEAFKKWLKYVLEKTGQIEKIAESEGFTGKKKTTTTKEDDDAAAEEALKFGPCEGGKKIELATGLPINC